MAIVCVGVLSTDINGAAVCDVAWIDQSLDLTSIQTLTDSLDILFEFDPDLFGLIFFGAVTLWLAGWGLGVCVRLLGKT